MSEREKMQRLVLSLTAQIPSGKNQIQLSMRNGRILKYPNQRFVKWRECAALDIFVQRAKWVGLLRQELPLRGPLAMHVKYGARDKRTRDISGMVDALFHLLTYAELIEDDGQIKTLTWTPVEYKTHCVELEITGA